MRDDFAVFILTHGRPDRVVTMNTIRRGGYTGKVFLVVDDEDKALDEYRARYGDAVIVFSKQEAQALFDECDNFEGRRGVVYARNASFGLARGLGLKYFLQLDDDYTNFSYRGDERATTARITLDDMFSAMVDFLEESGALTVATSQGGDHIGGIKPATLRRLRRKAMNTFFCSVERPFTFNGRINEDVNAYVEHSRTGGLFFTVNQVQVNQTATQQNGGGMTGLYLDLGTYVKSFYSVILCPSGARVGELGDGRALNGGNYRLHHRIDWDAVAPRIINASHRARERNGVQDGKP